MVLKVVNSLVYMCMVVMAVAVVIVAILFLDGAAGDGWFAAFGHVKMARPWLIIVQGWGDLRDVHALYFAWLPATPPCHLAA